MERRKKEKEIFFAGFCVTFILAASAIAFLWVDYTLSTAGFDGGEFARGAAALWDQIQQWTGAVRKTLRTGAEEIVNFLKLFLQQIGNLLHCVASVL